MRTVKLAPVQVMNLLSLVTDATPPSKIVERGIDSLLGKLMEITRAEMSEDGALTFTKPNSETAVELESAEIFAAKLACIQAMQGRQGKAPATAGFRRFTIKPLARAFGFETAIDKDAALPVGSDADLAITFDDDPKNSDETKKLEGPKQ